MGIWVKFSKFCFVGVLSTITNYSVFYALFTFLGVFYVMASATGYISGVMVGFLLNRRYTFDIKMRTKVSEIARYGVVYSSSMIVGLIVLSLLVEITGIPETLAQVFTIGVTTILNFTGVSIFVFDEFRAQDIATVLAALLKGIRTGHGLKALRRMMSGKLKRVGISLYLDTESEFSKAHEKVAQGPDFIHLDLVDKTFKDDCNDVDLNKGIEAKKIWPKKKIFTHIMSRSPTIWIPKVADFSDTIIIHYEIDEDVETVLKSIPCRKGLCVLPKTNMKDISHLLKYVDLVQILGIDEPGNTHKDISNLALKRSDMYLLEGLEVHLDGGVRVSNGDRIAFNNLVSNSALIESPDPYGALLSLKTGIVSAEERMEEAIRYVQRRILKVLGAMECVVSASIVGTSDRMRPGTNPSDVDVVAITKKLEKEVYHDIMNSTDEIANCVKEQYGYELFLNTTFGPAKNYAKDRIVLHLMIYDVEGHIEHCIDSPFTCLDWEHSEMFIKKHLTEVFKTPFLMPNDFIGSRRGIMDYMEDLSTGTMSIRKFYMEGKSMKTHLERVEMEDKDRFEYAYHMLKFLMLNFLKLHYKQNVHLEDKEIANRFFKITGLDKKYLKHYFMLRKCKMRRSFYGWDDRQKVHIRDFLGSFEEFFRENYLNGSKKIVLIRHAPTKNNVTGVFMGQRYDPDVLPVSSKEKSRVISLLEKYKFSKFYSSPMRRCTSTLKALGFENMVEDELLKEINYGHSDGMSIQELKNSFPEIISAWNKGEDIRFPDGENMGDVLQRSRKVLKKVLYEEGDTLLCTHNVVIRAILGKLMRMPKDQWYLLHIPHLTPIELVLAKNNKLYLNIDKPLLRKVTENLRNKALRDCTLPRARTL